MLLKNFTPHHRLNPAQDGHVNASKSGKEIAGKGELVDDVASGRVDIGSIEAEKLPAWMQAMAPEEQLAIIQEKAAKRDELKRQIATLAKQRSSFIKEEVATRGDAESSLDYKIIQRRKRAGREKGLHYEADAPAY